MWANLPLRNTRAGAAGQSYQWQSLAWQTASSQWPPGTVHELTDLRPVGGQENKVNKQKNKINDMMKRGGNGGRGIHKRGKQ